MCEKEGAVSKLGFISGLIVNVAVASGLSAVTLTSGVGGEWSSGSQTSLTSCRHGNLYFRFRSRFCFQSEFYFRNNAYSTAFSCA